jgi:hypothetical protein
MEHVPIGPVDLLCILFGFVLGWAARSEDLGGWRPRWLKRRAPKDPDSKSDLGN